MSNIENITTFYTEDFGKHLCKCKGIVSLQKGDIFTDKLGNRYEVTYKLFNVADLIMVYQGKKLT